MRSVAGMVWLLAALESLSLSVNNEANFDITHIFLSIMDMQILKCSNFFSSSLIGLNLFYIYLFIGLVVMGKTAVKVGIVDLPPVVGRAPL